MDGEKTIFLAYFLFFLQTVLHKTFASRFAEPLLVGSLPAVTLLRVSWTRV